MATLYLDGTDAATYGVYLSGEPDGWLDGPAIDVSAATYAGGVGGVLSRYPTTPPRRLRIPIGVTAATGGTTTRQTYEDWLKAFLEQSIPVRIDEGASAREIEGVIVAVALQPLRRVGVPVSRGSLTLLCPDPHWRAVVDTVETISGTPNTLTLGNAPVVDWVLTITATTNSITDITITLGPTTLTWTGTIAAGQALVIDASAFTVKNNGVDALATYSGGFPAIHPKDTPAVSATKASGSGTLGGSLVYKKRYR